MPEEKIVKRRNIVKTRRIKNAEVFVNGGSSVLKLNRFKPKKHDTKICNCIDINEQYVTAYVKKGDTYLFCHKKMTEVKVRNFFGKRIILKKKDYKTLNGYADLKAELKSVFSGKQIAIR